MVSTVYVCSADQVGLIFVATSKKKLYEYLITTELYRPTKAHNYITFSQILKWNNPMLMDVTAGKIKIERVPINLSILKGNSMFG